MDLGTFIKTSLGQIVRAVESASTESNREILLTLSSDHRTVEFDVAVVVEKTSGKTGKAGIKVLEFIGADASLQTSDKNSTISRIRFGVNVATRTREQIEQERRIVNEINNRPNPAR